MSSESGKCASTTFKSTISQLARGWFAHPSHARDYHKLVQISFVPSIALVEVSAITITILMAQSVPSAIALIPRILLMLAQILSFQMGHFWMMRGVCWTISNRTFLIRWSESLSIIQTLGPQLRGRGQVVCLSFSLCYSCAYAVQRGLPANESKRTIARYPKHIFPIELLFFSRYI